VLLRNGCHTYASNISNKNQGNVAQQRTFILVRLSRLSAGTSQLSLTFTDFSSTKENCVKAISVTTVGGRAIKDVRGSAYTDRNWHCIQVHLHHNDSKQHTE
jgi:hypothetical protein